MKLINYYLRLPSLTHIHIHLYLQHAASVGVMLNWNAKQPAFPGVLFSMGPFLSPSTSVVFSPAGAFHQPKRAFRLNGTPMRRDGLRGPFRWALATPINSMARSPIFGNGTALVGTITLTWRQQSASANQQKHEISRRITRGKPFIRFWCEHNHNWFRELML